ncbi:MAG: hypothetical protein WCK32_00920 [Chlorobiaceae bacterium]
MNIDHYFEFYCPKCGSKENVTAKSSEKKVEDFGVTCPLCHEFHKVQIFTQTNEVYILTLVTRKGKLALRTGQLN